MKNSLDEKRIIAIIFISLLSVLDIFLMVLLIAYNKYQFLILLLHILLFIIFKYLTNRYLLEYKGVPNYIFLFLFGLGGIILSILYFSLNYFLRDSIILDDYERYVHYEELLNKASSINYEKEVKTISFLDQMKLMDVETKKQLILNFIPNKSINKLKFLKTGLNDRDIEVQHYSAIMLNMLENELSETINALRNNYNITKEINLLFKMAKEYKNYIDSELLTGKVLEAFNGEYIDVLNRIIQVKKENLEVLDELVKAYLRCNNLTHAEEINERILEAYPDSLQAYFNKIRASYERGEFNNIYQLIEKIPIDIEKMPKNYKNITCYWKGKEDKDGNMHSS